MAISTVLVDAGVHVTSPPLWIGNCHIYEDYKLRRLLARVPLDGAVAAAARPRAPFPAPEAAPGGSTSPRREGWCSPREVDCWPPRRHRRRASVPHRRRMVVIFPFAVPLDTDLHHETFVRRVPVSVIGVRDVEKVVAGAEESTLGHGTQRSRDRLHRSYRPRTPRGRG